MMLAQLATVKTRNGVIGTDDDTLITNLIKFCGDRFDKETRRQLERSTSATEEVPAYVLELRLPRFPVESISTFHLKDNEDGGWVAQTGIVYRLNKLSGVVSFDSPVGGSNQMLKITYTGGFVMPGTSPGGGQTALPDGLEQACVEQVSLWYQARQRLGLESLPAFGNNFFKLKDTDLLPQVKAMLKRYEAYWV